MKINNTYQHTYYTIDKSFIIHNLSYIFQDKKHLNGWKNEEDTGGLRAERKEKKKGSDRRMA